MKKPEDILSDAIKALAGTPVPPGPPPELIDATVAKLKAADSSQKNSEIIKITGRFESAKRLIKFAAAAVLVLSTGYTIGRLTAPNRPDIEQLRAALEPAIRQNLLQEMTAYFQVGLTSSYTQLKDELQQQYRRDLSELAIQTLAASGAVTNQRLEELIDAINTAQMQDRQWFTTSLKQIELNRLQDKTQLSAGLETLALQTEDQFQQTRQDIIKLLSYTQPSNEVPNEFRNSSNK